MFDFLHPPTPFKGGIPVFTFIFLLLSFYPDTPDATVRIFDPVRLALTNAISSGIFVSLRLLSFIL